MTNNESSAMNIAMQGEFASLKFQKIKSKHRQGGGSGKPAAMSIVNAGRCGHRFSFASSVIEGIGNPKRVYLEIAEKALAVRACRDSGEGFELRTSGKKFIVYSKEAVEEVADVLGLDFKGHTSLSFSEVIFVNDGDEVVALIPVTGETQAEHGEDRSGGSLEE